MRGAALLPEIESVIAAPVSIVVVDDPPGSESR